MKPIEGKILFLIIVVVEILAIALAIILGFIFKLSILDLFKFSSKDILIGIVATILLILINLLFIFVLPRYIKLLRPLKEAYEEVCGMVYDLNIFLALPIAIISGFAEELLFRGVIQQLLGIIIASIIFGICHIGNKKTLPYGIYTIFIGFYLGYLFIYTGNLLAPIIVHTINNAIAIPIMHFYYRKYLLKSD